MPMLATTEGDQDVMPTATDTVATPSTPEEHAEITHLCGEYFDCLVRALLKVSFFFLLFSYACCNTA